ncbi:MAG: hypothetical protein R6U35_05330 [Candidatus Humimicrobiaceae bacterium]
MITILKDLAYDHKLDPHVVSIIDKNYDGIKHKCIKAKDKALATYKGFEPADYNL